MNIFREQIEKRICEILQENCVSRFVDILPHAFDNDDEKAAWLKDIVKNFFPIHSMYFFKNANPTLKIVWALKLARLIAIELPGDYPPMLHVLYGLRNYSHGCLFSVHAYAQGFGHGNGNRKRFWNPTSAYNTITSTKDYEENNTILRSIVVFGQKSRPLKIDIVLAGLLVGLLAF